MSKDIYRSPYEAYPFLADEPEDFRCDFELLTDELSSMTGLLASKVEDTGQREELLRVDELIYHANPTLRTRMTITGEEIAWLKGRTEELRLAAKDNGKRFVLPQGSERACLAHLLRVKSKCLVRLLYRYAYTEGTVPHELFDFCNLLSGYFFGLALLFNRLENVTEREFFSRNY